jgi:hypothetical protein
MIQMFSICGIYLSRIVSNSSGPALWTESARERCSLTARVRWQWSRVAASVAGNKSWRIRSDSSPVVPATPPIGQRSTGDETNDMLYQEPKGVTGMRAGLVWRLRARSIRYQPTARRRKNQSLVRLVLLLVCRNIGDHTLRVRNHLHLPRHITQVDEQSANLRHPHQRVLVDQALQHPGRIHA